MMVDIRPIGVAWTSGSSTIICDVCGKAKNWTYCAYDDIPDIRAKAKQFGWARRRKRIYPAEHEKIYIMRDLCPECAKGEGG